MQLQIKFPLLFRKEYHKRRETNEYYPFSSISLSSLTFTPSGNYVNYSEMSIPALEQPNVQVGYWDKVKQSQTVHIISSDPAPL